VDFVELSIESLREESKRLAGIIAKDWQPDLVIYLAKGGFLIGEEIAIYFNAGLLEFDVHRTGDKVKQNSAIILSKLPKYIRKKLRESELKTRFKADNGQTQSKTLHLTKRYQISINPMRVLIVDDSADTGSSLLSAKNLAEALFPNVEIKIATLNVFDEALLRVQIDWYLYANCLLGTPASKDNKDYKKFLNLYENVLSPNSESANK